MAKSIIPKEVNKILQKKEFINVSSCDFQGRPNVAPKFLLRAEGDFIYLADYVMGRTWRNLKINPRVSMSTLNLDTLMGYQINGKAELIKNGKEYKNLISEYREKKVDFSTLRVVEGVRRGREHEHIEDVFPEKVVFFKIKVNEIVRIVPTGELERKKNKKNE